MRAHFNTTTSASNLVRPLFIVTLAVVAISTLSSSDVVRADGPPGGGSTPIVLEYFGVTMVGTNLWMAEGVVTAENNTAVTVVFSGASSATKHPDSVGYFSHVFTANPFEIIVVDATDSTGTVHGEAVCDPYQF